MAANNSEISFNNDDDVEKEIPEKPLSQREGMINFPLLIPTFHQIPYTTLTNRIDQGSQSLLELSTILNERKEIEEKNIHYYTRVSRSNLFNYEIETSSSERLLGFFKNYHLYLSKEYHNRFNKDYQEQIIKILDEYKIQRANMINKNKNFITGKLKEVSLAEDLLDRSKKLYMKNKKDYEKSVEKLINYEKIYQEAKQKELQQQLLLANSGGIAGAGGSGGNTTGGASVKEGKFSNVARMFSSAFESTPEQDRDRQQKKVEKRKEEMNQSYDQILEKKQILLDLLKQLDEGFYKAASEFEDTETDRMRKINSTLKTFCKLERSCLEFRLEALAQLEDAVTQQNITEDIALFIEQAKQTELTHQYASALSLIDEYYQRQAEQNPPRASERNRNHSVDASNTWVTVEGIEGGINLDEIRKSRRTSASVEDVTNKEQPEKLGDDSNHIENMDEKISIAERTEEDEMASILEELNKQLEVIFANTINSDPVSASPSQVIKKTVESKPSSTTVVEEDLWRILLETKECRDRFLQELDNQRCHTSSVTETAYVSLRNAMKVILDLSEDISDVRSAMRVKNMANTFHIIEENPNPNNRKSPVKSNGREGEERSLSSSSSSSKRYLHSDVSIQHHSIWKLPGFWENALKEDIFKQLSHQSSISPWDELNPDLLREAVISIHTMLFGQLGSISMTMLEQGLTKTEVLHQIKSLSKKFQLTEDQEFELITNITGQAIKTYNPPPVIPTIIKNKSIEISSTELPSQNVVTASAIVVEEPKETKKPPTPATNVTANATGVEGSKRQSISLPKSPVGVQPKVQVTTTKPPPPSAEKDPNIMLKRFSKTLKSLNPMGSSSTETSKARSSQSAEDDEFAVL